MLELGVLRIRSFALGSLVTALRMFGIGAAGLLVPLQFSDVFHAEPIMAAVALTINGLALFALMRAGGALSDSCGCRRLIRWGFLAQGLAMAPLVLVADWSVAAVTIPLALQGLAASLVQAPVHQVAMRDVPARQSGMASGVYSLIRYLGMTMGPVVCGAVLKVAGAHGTPAAGAYRLAWAAVTAATLLGAGAALLLPADPRADQGTP